MNEYNYTYNSTEENNAPKPSKKHTGMKAAAFIMAMALTSAGSIGIYRHFEDGSFSGTVVTDDEDDSEDSLPDRSGKAAADLLTPVAAHNIGIIEPDTHSGKALSNEEIVQKLLPSVVGIESKFTAENVQGNDFFSYGFGFDFGSSLPRSGNYTGTGTGVIISDDGYIVTNAHVIFDSEYGAGLADSVSVLLDNDDSYDAEVVGYDVDCDLAVLKIDETGLTAAEFGDSDKLMLGESVIAIGNPLGFELMKTVTGGMISGLDRNITINDKAMNLIQTDAAINSGNSGGPLINKYGQVIGINSSKMSSTYSSGASIEGIGFAIPSNATAAIVDDLVKYGYVTGKPQLGISCQDVTETVSEMYNLPVGVYVTAVNEGSAAEKAGLKEGDVIIAIDGETVTTAAELTAKKNLHSAGEKVKLTFIRSGEEKTVKLTLDEAESLRPLAPRDNS